MAIKDSEKLSGNLLSSKIKASKAPTCAKCGSTRVIIDDVEHTEIACMDCGFVGHQESIISKETEWKNNNKEKPEITQRQTDVPLTCAIHCKEASTVIDLQRQTCYDQNVAGQKVHAYRLRKWQRRVRVSNSTESNFIFALSEITKMSNALDLHRNVLETALFIYRKTAKERLVSGRSIQSVASAVLYLACKQYDLSRTLDDIVQVSSVDKKEVGRSYRCLIKSLNYSMPSLLLDQYMTDFFSRFTVQEKTEEIAYKILSVAKESNLTVGCDVRGAAVVVCYIALVLMGECKSIKEVADMAQITDMTIRKCYEELEKRLKIKISI